MALFPVLSQFRLALRKELSSLVLFDKPKRVQLVRHCTAPLALRGILPSSTLTEKSIWFQPEWQIIGHNKKWSVGRSENLIHSLSNSLRLRIFFRVSLQICSLMLKKLFAVKQRLTRQRFSTYARNIQLRLNSSLLITLRAALLTWITFSVFIIFLLDYFRYY